MKVHVSDIEWDTEVDGEIQDVDLPTEMTVEVDAESMRSEEELFEAVLDEVSNATGFCVLSSTIEYVAGKPLRE